MISQELLKQIRNLEFAENPFVKGPAAVVTAPKQLRSRWKFKGAAVPMKHVQGFPRGGFGYVLLQERLSGIQAFGCVLVLAAAGGIAWKGTKKSLIRTETVHK